MTTRSLLSLLATATLARSPVAETSVFEDTTSPLKIPGGASLTLFCRGTNNHICMNNPPPLGRGSATPAA